MKTKIKYYNGKINTIFKNQKTKEGSQCICLSVNLIISIFKTDRNYYPQVFWGECQYAVKKKIPEYITHEIPLLILIENFLMKKT